MNNSITLSTNDHSPHPTLETLVAIESRLCGLLVNIATSSPPTFQPAYDEAWRNWTATISSLVGEHANHCDPTIKSKTAHSVVFNCCLAAFESAAATASRKRWRGSQSQTRVVEGDELLTALRAQRAVEQ